MHTVQDKIHKDRKSNGYNAKICETFQSIKKD